MESMKITELGNSYWNETGAYQNAYQQLYDKLVPSSGNAKTLNGELIRAISRLFYEYCNNGNCNAVDETTGISSFYEKFISLIEETVPGISKDTQNLRNLIMDYDSSFSDSEMDLYNKVCDKVMFFVINNEDKALPENYEQD